MHLAFQYAQKQNKVFMGGRSSLDTQYLYLDVPDGVHRAIVTLSTDGRPVSGDLYANQVARTAIAKDGRCVRLGVEMGVTVSLVC
jgi:hypothetical protein